MSQVDIATSELLRLLSVLLHTTASKVGTGLASVLLHTTRDYIGSEPGKADLLFGSSSTGIVVGHYHVPAAGQLSRPVLIAAADADAVVKLFKPKLKANKDHRVNLELRRADGKPVVVVAEDPDLFGDGLQVQFDEAPLSDYPRYLWSLLSDVRVGEPMVYDAAGQQVPRRVRTDFGVESLTAFARVGKQLGAPVEFYQFHQRLPVLVQIGGAYRGVLTPVSWEDHDPAQQDPTALVRPPDLPPPPNRDARDTDPDRATHAGILRTGAGVVLGDPPAEPPVDEHQAADAESNVVPLFSEQPADPPAIEEE